MSHKMLRPFIVKVSVLGYYPIHNFYICYQILSYDKLSMSNKSLIRTL